jgi:hypothetical protein
MTAKDTDEVNRLRMQLKTNSRFRLDLRSRSATAYGAPVHSAVISLKQASRGPILSFASDRKEVPFHRKASRKQLSVS